MRTSRRAPIEIPAPLDWPLQELSIRIVGIQEKPKEWLAVALELDVMAYGATFEEAQRTLVEMVVAQMSFAVQKRDPGLLFKDAEPFYWQVYERAHSQKMRRLIVGDTNSVADTIRAGVMALEQGVISQFQRLKPFKRLHAS